MLSNLLLLFFGLIAALVITLPAQASPTEYCLVSVIWDSVPSSAHPPLQKDICDSKHDPCQCLNPCGYVKVMWEHYIVREQLLECDVPCVKKTYETNYLYFCDDAACVTHPNLKCCTCTGDPDIPVKVVGPDEYFWICPPH